MLLLWTLLLCWRPAIRHHSVLIFFTVHFCWSSPGIRHQHCAKPEPTAKYSWWNRKENNEFTLQKICGVNLRKEITQATKSKTNRLASNVFLSPSKRRKRRVCWDPTRSDIPSDSDTELAVPFDDDSPEEKKDSDCVYSTGRFSEDYKGEEWIQCAKYFRWAYTLCVGMEEDCICEPCQG